MAIHPAVAQEDDVDPEKLALTYHKITSQPFDFERAAMLSRVVSNASAFDRPDVTKQEVARLHALYDAGSDKTEFATVVDDSISQYDHERGEFSVGLFQPGTYLSFYVKSMINAEYRVVFANAESARPIRIADKEQARAFDTALNQIGRRVETHVRFRIVGMGDPAGLVSGQNIVKAELISARVVDRNGKVVSAPDLKAAAALLAASAPPPFSPAAVDVAGLKVGGDIDDLQSAVERLYGKPQRHARGKSDSFDERYAGYIELDLMKCMNLSYASDRRREPRPGDVCMRAYYDADEVVRAVQIERIVPRLDYELLRRSAIAHYGPVSAANGGGDAYVMGWGPSVDQSLLIYGTQQRNPLVLNVKVEEGFDLGGNSIPQTFKIGLALIDSDWANKKKD